MSVAYMCKELKVFCPGPLILALIKYKNILTLYQYNMRGNYIDNKKHRRYFYENNTCLHRMSYS